MARVTPERFATKHAERLKASTADMAAGVERLTESPTLAAAAKEKKMIDHLTEAVRTGKWASALKKVSLEDWKKAYKDKGILRVAAGIDAAHDKQVEFATALLAHTDAGQAAIKGMADMTLEDGINRMTKFARHMATFRKP